MDSQYNTMGVENGREKDQVLVANKRNMSGWDLVLRFLAIGFCFAAAVVLGVDKQNTTVAISLVSTLPPIIVPVTAKWHYLSSFVYFVVANAIACTYGAISLLLSMANRGGKKSISKLIIISDLVMVALLFSSIGSAVAIGLMGFEGNSRVQWKKVCGVFDKFCHQGAAAFGLSGFAAFLFFLLVVLAVLNLHKKH